MSNTLLDSVMENLATAAIDYSVMLNEADALGCTVSALPKATERLSKLKAQLENLQGDIQNLPETEQKTGAKTHTIFLLNTINHFLSTI